MFSQPYNHRKDFESEMSAPDWSDPNMPSGQTGDLNPHFVRMNLNARPFIPNIRAQPFVPGGYGAPFGYPMTGPPHQMHPGAMYGQPLPGIPMGVHQQPIPQRHHYMMPPHGQMMPPAGMQQPSQQHPNPIPVSVLEADLQQPTKQPIYQQQQQQQQQQQWPFSESQTRREDPTTQVIIRGSPPTRRDSPPDTSREPSSEESRPKGETSQDITVDSWEDIADTSESQPTTSTDTIILSTTETQKPKLPRSSTEKNPSPVLSDRGGSKPKAEGESLGKNLAKVAPPKKEEDMENVNIVFIGHVDAGKSTIGGHVMYLTGQVDKRTLEKYEREARDKNRETWYLSWALDTNQEERDKGKTVEVGRASFETDKKRFTILDAPGHAGFVPNMISGAAQADIGVLVISARRGEFETGFERRGQTREHAMLAKTAGVKHLVVLINKMDDPTVMWSEERYEECKTKLTPFLKKVGFNPKTDIYFIPVSGLTGINLKERAPKDVCPWYSGPAFIPYLDVLPPLTREDTGPFRLPIADKYKDMGTVVLGKVESGGVMKGSSLLLMPNRVSVEVLSVIRVEEEVPTAYSGDNIKLKLKGIEEEDISPGFVLCDPSSPCHVGHVFDAQIVILEHKSIICAGYSAVLHIHSVVEEVQIKQLLALVDKKTGKRQGQRPRFIKQDHVAIARLQTTGVICLETFKEFPQMARFTLRDEGKTIAIGKVLKLIE